MEDDTKPRLVLKANITKGIPCAPAGGQAAISNTYSRLNVNFTWNIMRRDVMKFLSK